MQEAQTNGKTAEASSAAIQMPSAAVEQKPVHPVISDERVQALLAGKAPSRSEMSKYLIERAREALANGRQIQDRLSYARSMIVELENEANRVAGQVEGYIHDIKYWEAKTITDTMTGEAQPSEKKE